MRPHPFLDAVCSDCREHHLTRQRPDQRGSGSQAAVNGRVSPADNNSLRTRSWGSFRLLRMGELAGSRQSEPLNETQRRLRR